MPSPWVAGQIPARAKALNLPGRPVAKERLHLALSLLGAVEVGRIKALIEKTNRIMADAFSVTLDRQGRFCPPGIAWLGPAGSPPALLRLAAILDKNTASCIVSCRNRPQVTTGYDAQMVRPTAIEPIE